MANKIMGYARVSTDGQNLNSQLEALEKAGAEKIFQEKITGSKKDRPELSKMLEQLRSGDTVIVYSLSRIGRSLKNLIELMEVFKEKEVNFISITEGIDTSTSTGKFMFHIMASLAEFQRDIIRDSTKAGLESARARGKKGGRKRLATSKVKTALELYDSKKYSLSEIEEMANISRPTIYRYLKQREQERKAQEVTPAKVAEIKE